MSQRAVRGLLPAGDQGTGVAWALVIGGLGAIAGPLVGATLIDRHLAPVAILALLSIPSLLCAAGIGLIRREWQHIDMTWSTTYGSSRTGAFAPRSTISTATFRAGVSIWWNRSETSCRWNLTRS